MVCVFDLDQSRSSYTAHNLPCHMYVVIYLLRGCSPISDAASLQCAWSWTCRRVYMAQRVWVNLRMHDDNFVNHGPPLNNMAVRSVHHVVLPGKLLLPVALELQLDVADEEQEAVALPLAADKLV